MSIDEQVPDALRVETPSVRRRPPPSVGPRLRRLLMLVFVLLAILGANSVYLSSVTIYEALAGETLQNFFYQFMFLAHLVLGLILIVPFVAFAAIHIRNTRKRLNRRAIRVGYALFAVGMVVLISGVALMRLGPFDLRQPAVRSAVYWAHVISPLVAIWLYVLHRLVGPKIRWRLGLAYGGGVGALAVAMLFLHRTDPRPWYAVGPKEGVKYFEPSLARTASGNFIPANVLQDDAYCKQCHADVHAQWSNSVHRFSSFNNPAYLASIRETREFSKKQQGNVQRARWCAGCHDPVPLFSGAFDDPNYDDVHHPTAHAGITCTTCHAITHVNSTRGNADYTIEEPLHYPFTTSDNPLLQWVNRQLIKAKPEFHKKTFLKPFHKDANFCSTCHKVHLPVELNDYKFVRGQNHHDPFLLSGVSGHGVRSFYYPPQAKQKCSSCHMPLAASGDFGAKYFDNAEQLSVHNHLFPAANTAISWFRERPDIIAAHQAFLKDIIRVDLFGLREGESIDGRLTAPIRPQIPAITPGKKYVFDAVIRTLKLGHIFTQGTADSNEVWLDVTVKSGDRVIGRLGQIDDQGEVDPWTHFVNVFMLDKHGNHISRRNPQDIFVPLYNNQIPPGAAATVHLGFAAPDDLKEPVVVEVKLQYRKFSAEYMDFVTRTAREGDLPIRGHERGKSYHNQLPITTLAVDRVEFPVGGQSRAAEPSAIPVWERFNDYGIGMLLKETAELRQAEQAFVEVEKLGRFDGPLNLARVYQTEGRLDDAVAALGRASQHANPAAPWWTAAWLGAVIDRQQGNFDSAEEKLRAVLREPTADLRQRGFDFRLDYEVINLLAQTLFDRALVAGRVESGKGDRESLLRQAAEQFETTLTIDSENVTAHYGLSLVYRELGDLERAAKHAAFHEKYKPDDNARDQAISTARKKYPAADHAAERVVIYSLNRSGSPNKQPPRQVDPVLPSGGAK